MKQFLCLILSAVLLTGLLAGCGKKKNDTESDPAAGAAGTLTIQEDDTMNLNMLFSLMSTPDHGVTELLGEGNDQKYNGDGILTQREYDGIAYGQHIIFTVSYNDYGDVSSIDRYGNRIAEPSAQRGWQMAFRYCHRQHCGA